MGESKSRVVERSLGCCAIDGSIRQESGSVLHGMGLLCSEFTTGSFLSDMIVQPRSMGIAVGNDWVLNCASPTASRSPSLLVVT